MKRVLLMTMAGLLMASSAMAGMENVRFALHRKPIFTATKTIATLCPNATNNLLTPNYSPNWNSTTSIANPLPCTGYSVSGGTVGLYSEVYIVVGRAGAEGVQGASFGIDYDAALDPGFVGWQKCTDGLDFPNAKPGGVDFPGQGGGMRITWSSCENLVVGTAGVHAVVGSLHIYGYEGAVFMLTPNNNLQSGPELAVANCSGQSTDLLLLYPPVIWNQMLGKVGFGAGVGYNPCLVTPVAATTWGKVKTLYNN